MWNGKNQEKISALLKLKDLGDFFSTFSFVFLLLLRFQFLLSTQLKHRPTSSADLPISVNGNSVAFIAPAKTPGIMRGSSPSCLTPKWLNPVGSSFRMPPLSFLPSPLPSDPADHHHCLSYWNCIMSDLPAFPITPLVWILHSVARKSLLEYESYYSSQLFKILQQHTHHHNLYNGLLSPTQAGPDYLSEKKFSLSTPATLTS